MSNFKNPTADCELTLTGGRRFYEALVLLKQTGDGGHTWMS